MSTFKVEVRKISEVTIHPNAERLSLCKVEGLGYQFVTGKDQYKIGDLVVFFPLDAEIPLPLIEAMGMVGKFSGPLKNRVATVKLRGALSQGYVCSVDTIKKYLGDIGLFVTKLFENDILTESLGVTKYDPEPESCHAGSLVRLPTTVPIYDIEGVDRNQNIVDYIIQNKIKVMISEKLEGSNYSCTAFKDGRVVVNQRKHSIKEMPEQGEHKFWKVSRELGILEMMKNIQMDTGAEDATIRGEFLGPGVQKNLYKFKQFQLRFFDLMLTGVYVNVEDFLRYAEKFGFKDLLVPILAVDVYLDEWLAGKTVQQAAGGKSALGFEYREGIVIKPMVETFHPDIGRLIIKHRDAEYLEKTGF